MARLQVEINQLDKRADNNDEEIFNISNQDPDKLLQFADFHHTNRHLCKRILERLLNNLQAEIDSGKVKPNLPHYNCHIYQIITGAGHHSKDGKPVLKGVVDEYLTERRVNYHKDLNQGQFLVQIRKH